MRQYLKEKQPPNLANKSRKNHLKKNNSLIEGRTIEIEAPLLPNDPSGDVFEIQDIDDDDDSDVSDDGIFCVDVPTTSAAETNYDYELDAPDDTNATPLYELLNKQGRCLIRKNYKLHMSKRVMQFYEKIIAQFQGMTVPTIYAEGMIFSDSFF